ncbi:CHAT domain-containing protein [Actinokineospora cianjurensis]|uniref:Tetratricopeptide repeat protein n=1 Tax=Actinokineospora cianjurensis TaxID=585224 RepID=A0A421BC60_9PSEU|nr:CHAT domain-containing protein [Actinokineospora cianjurensis]RLK61926.1 tetratricopeptide repeat protein [Actinokineospora cianjurensis]
MTIDDLTRRLRAWLDRYDAEHDPATVLAPAALADALALGETIGDHVTEHAEAAAAVGLLHWYRYLLLPEPDDRPDLDEAIAVFRQVQRSRPDLVPDAVREALAPANIPCPDNDPWTLMGGDLIGEYEANGDRNTLDTAIAAFRLALAHMLPDDHRAQLATLLRLGSALLLDGESTGSPSVLDEAVDVFRKSLDLGDRDRSPGLTGLMAALYLRYRRHGRSNDLDEIIEVGYEAAGSVPQDDPERFRLLSLLAIAHHARFQYTGESYELDRAIDAGANAVANTDEDHSELAGRLSNLGIALRARYERTGDVEDLETAIDVTRRAVHATPTDHPDLPRHLSNLGIALRARYERTGDVEDLETAIDVTRRAVHATPTDHPDLPRHLSNLGIALRARYERTGDVEDLETAIDVTRRAVHATPTDHPDRTGALLNLGGTLLANGESCGDRELLTEAVRVLRAASNTTVVGSPMRALVTTYLGRAAAAVGDWQLAVEVFDIAIDAVDQMVWHGADRDDSEFHLAKFSGLASDAAACALNAGDPSRAVELWEHGRGVLLTQSLDLSTNLTELARRAPHLAARFATLRDRLGGLGPQGNDDPSSSPEQPERVARREWNDVVEAIRGLPGFEGFLRRMTTADLLDAAAAGPVVLLNVSRYRSDALALTSDGVSVIRLPEVNPEKVELRLATLDAAVTWGGSRHQEDRLLDEVLGWLWDTVARPVLDGIGLTSRRAPGDDLPRLWWCPSGTLSFLPLHMAGYHDAPAGDVPTTVPDLVVSSYTPTIRALVHARRQRAGKTRAPHVLAVATSHAPGVPDLPAARSEAAALGDMFPASAVVLADADATRDAVLAAIPQGTIAHFACHGITDPVSPSSSGLLLADQMLTVRDLAELRLEDAELAYLSACDTASPDPRLADEAIHVATAFQLTGFRHVIATLWPLTDNAAKLIAEQFYKHLNQNGRPTPDCAAFALHAATRTLQARRPGSRRWWMSMIHVGP